jgi:hypothetical protein
MSVVKSSLLLIEGLQFWSQYITALLVKAIMAVR